MTIPFVLIERGNGAAAAAPFPLSYAFIMPVIPNEVRDLLVNLLDYLLRYSGSCARRQIKKGASIDTLLYHYPLRKLFTGHLCIGMNACFNRSTCGMVDCIVTNHSSGFRIYSPGFFP